MNVKIKENSWMARVAAWKLGVKKVAFTLGRTIHLHNTSPEYFLSDRKWVLHELQHVTQFQRYGFLRFLLLYLRESIRHGYYDNVFEQEARRAEESGKWRMENGQLIVGNKAWKLTIHNAGPPADDLLRR